jgi:hypothetical protein
VTVEMDEPTEKRDDGARVVAVEDVATACGTAATLEELSRGHAWWVTLIELAG